MASDPLAEVNALEKTIIRVLEDPLGGTSVKKTLARLETFSKTRPVAKVRRCISFLHVRF